MQLLVNKSETTSSASSLHKGFQSPHYLEWFEYSRKLLLATNALDYLPESIQAVVRNSSSNHQTLVRQSSGILLKALLCASCDYKLCITLLTYGFLNVYVQKSMFLDSHCPNQGFFFKTAFNTLNRLF